MEYGGGYDGGGGGFQDGGYGGGAPTMAGGPPQGGGKGKGRGKGFGGGGSPSAGGGGGAGGADDGAQPLRAHSPEVAALGVGQKLTKVGTVKSYWRDKGFGFLNEVDGLSPGEDVLFNRNDLPGQYYYQDHNQMVGKRLMFDLLRSARDGRFKALNLMDPNLKTWRSTISYYNPDKGFGFIKTPDGLKHPGQLLEEQDKKGEMDGVRPKGRDVFLSARNLVDEIARSSKQLAEQVCMFSVDMTDTGPHALHVRLPTFATMHHHNHKGDGGKGGLTPGGGWYGDWGGGDWGGYGADEGADGEKGKGRGSKGSEFDSGEDGKGKGKGKKGKGEGWEDWVGPYPGAGGKGGKGGKNNGHFPSTMGFKGADANVRRERMRGTITNFSQGGYGFIHSPLLPCEVFFHAMDCVGGNASGDGLNKGLVVEFLCVVGPKDNKLQAREVQACPPGTDPASVPAMDGSANAGAPRHNFGDIAGSLGGLDYSELVELQLQVAQLVLNKRDVDNPPMEGGAPQMAGGMAGMR